MRQTFILASGIALAAIVTVFVQPEAQADKAMSHTIQSSKSRVEELRAVRMPDAGFQVTVCGKCLIVDGGEVPCDEGPCDVCAVGGSGAAMSTCISGWKTNRGL